MGERVTVHIGPIASSIATGWIANRQQLVEASRDDDALGLRSDALDLLDMILGLWSIEADRSDTFDWSYDFDLDVFVLIARHWLDLGGVSVDRRVELGVPEPPLYTEAFTEAVVQGMVAALRTAGPAGQPLLDRLGL